MGIPNLTELAEIYADDYNALCAEGNEDNIPDTSNWGKKEFLVKLRELHMPREGLPYTELNPMLCFQGYKLEKERIQEMFDDPDWVAQRKLNGVRAVAHFVKGVGIFIHTRTVSVKSWRFVDSTSKFLFRDYIPDFTAVMDGEVICDKVVDTRVGKNKGTLTKSSLHSVTALMHMDANASLDIQQMQDAPLIFKAFDLYQPLEPEATQETRLENLTYIFNEHIDTCPDICRYFDRLVSRYTAKKDFYHKVLDEGGEGIILKHKDSTYDISGGRRRDGWVKIKRALDFDAYVSGFKRGAKGKEWENMVGALEFSIMVDGQPQIIAYISGFSDELRESISTYDEGNDIVCMHPHMIGNMAAITGQDISSREMNLSHAKIDRWRDIPNTADYKRADQCTSITTKQLKEASKWVGV